MSASRRVLFVVLTFCVVGCVATNAQAGWQMPKKKANGHDVYLDTKTGLKWTKTLEPVPSADWGKMARARVKSLGPGWRLPTFGELQRMYNQHNGGSVLQIRTGMLDYYETANPSILGNAFGNGFQTPQTRQGIGNNWVIAVHN